MSDTTLMECQTCHIETDCIEGICEECRIILEKGEKENLEEHAQTQRNEASIDDEREELERREKNGSEDYPNGDMAEPYDLINDR